MKFFSQSHVYDDPWSIVSLAFFLRYPNPYAAHVVSCDVIDRTALPSGALRTTRLILKRGALPRWAPKGIMQKAESWILEESEVDAVGRTVSCRTRNLDHVKVMQVREEITLRPTEDGRTLHISTVNIHSRFGWGLTQRIEDHGLSKFQQNLQKSREGLGVILTLLRQQPMAMGLSGSLFHSGAKEAWVAREHSVSAGEEGGGEGKVNGGRWASLKRWVKAGDEKR